MKEYGTVRSTKQPDAKVIDESSVWIAADITEVSEDGTDEQPGFSGYEYTLTQYTKDEYIKLIDEKNESLEEELTQTQLGLAEVYEALA